MRMRASWFGSLRPTGYKVAARVPRAPTAGSPRTRHPDHNQRAAVLGAGLDWFRPNVADGARFEVVFADEPGATRIVWLFSLVLGFSRLIWARFVVHQDLQTVLRCHIAALEAIGGVPQEILYDRMKTAVIGEDADGLVVYNRGLLDLARHYGFQPRASRPYRPKTNNVSTCP